MVYFAGGLSLIAGLLAAIFQIEFLQRLGLGYESAAIGAIFLILGFFVQRRSLIALGLAITLYIIDGLLSVALTIHGSGNPSVAGIIMHVLLVIPMIQAIAAIRELK